MSETQELTNHTQGKASSITEKTITGKCNSRDLPCHEQGGWWVCLSHPQFPKWEKGVTRALLRLAGAAPEQKLACRNDVKFLNYTLVESLLDCMKFVSLQSTDYKGYCLWGYDSHELKEVKDTANPVQALRVQGGLGYQISRQSAHAGGRVAALRTGHFYPPRKYSWYSFLLRGWVNPRAIVQLEGLCQWEIPITPSVIKHATFRFVAQCLNRLHHRVPPAWLHEICKFTRHWLQRLLSLGYDCAYKFINVLKDLLSQSLGARIRQHTSEAQAYVLLSDPDSGSSSSSKMSVLFLFSW